KCGAACPRRAWKCSRRIFAGASTRWRAYWMPARTCSITMWRRRRGCTRGCVRRRLPAVARGARVCAAARGPCRNPGADEIGIHGWAGRDAGRSAHAVGGSARGGHGRGDHRAVSATHAAQPAGGGVRGAAAVRGVSRVRSKLGLQGSVQRTAGAQFVHGRIGQRGSAAGAVLNWLLALGSAALLILTFPKFSLVWLAPVALTPLLVAMAREPRWGRRFLISWSAGVAYWFGVCYWIQFVLSF